MMKLVKAVFLDFDGVLFDTVKEAYIVCLFATKKIKRIQAADYKSKDFMVFSKYRYLIGPAWNYFYLLRAIAEIQHGDKADIEKVYQSYLSKANSSVYGGFERDFFECREYLKRNYKEAWFKLNMPYSFLSRVSNLINRYPNHFFIVTTKDKDTVLDLLKISGQDFYMQNIYDRDAFKRFKTKGDILKNIMQEHSIRYAIFVDDNVSHCHSCDKIAGLKILQPEWGYILPRNNVVQEDEILSLIKKLLEEC